MKKIGPCTILHKFGPNAYEISLPPTISISPIFNVADLTIFKDTSHIIGTSTIGSHEDWLKYLPPSQPLELEAILESKIVKKKRNHTYFQYSIKWKGLPTIDATWMTEDQIKQHGFTLDQLTSSGNLSFFSPGQHGAGALFHEAKK